MTVALQNNAGFLQRAIVADPRFPIRANVSRLGPGKKRGSFLRPAGEDQATTK
jgi:hypothetical protein